MKKFCLTLLLLVPAMIASAVGPIRAWNDMLDDFIANFNEINPTLDAIYTGAGLDYFGWTYFDPETGNVVMEAQLFDINDLDNVDDELMEQAKGIALSHLQNSYKKSSRIQSIVNEFGKRGTDIDIMFSANNQNDQKIKKKVSFTPSQIKGGR